VERSNRSKADLLMNLVVAIAVDCNKDLLPAVLKENNEYYEHGVVKFPFHEYQLYNIVTLSGRDKQNDIAKTGLSKLIDILYCTNGANYKQKKKQVLRPLVIITNTTRNTSNKQNKKVPDYSKFKIGTLYLRYNSASKQLKKTAHYKKYFDNSLYKPTTRKLEQQQLRSKYL
jgi:hypothetical protein